MPGTSMWRRTQVAVGVALLAFGLTAGPASAAVTGISASKTTTGHLVKTYGWSLSSSVSPTAVGAASGATTQFVTYTVVATKDAGILWAYFDGQICVTNTGSVATQGLAISDSLTQPPNKTVLASTKVSVAAHPVLQAHETYCYPYRLDLLTNVTPGATYKDTASVTITNHPKGDAGPSPSATAALPTTVGTAQNDNLTVNGTIGGSFTFSASGSQTYARSFTCDADNGSQVNTFSASGFVAGGGVTAPTPQSATVTVTCSSDIGYAVLQYPKTINQVITANYTTVYGQIFIAGFTDSGGDPNGIKAQLGFGAPGSDPATWSTWSSMTYNPGHTGDNNYEYYGGLRADAIGTYDYLVRFSDDGGFVWVYGDQDGYYPGNPGTNQPGVLTVTASSDTTAPSAPVASIGVSGPDLNVSWTASTDPDDSVAEYRIYRGTSSGGEGATAVATVSGSTLSYLDAAVTAGQTYFYTVKAFDTSLNSSSASNEVSQAVQP